MARAIDPIWLVLASISTYLALVRAEGLPVARRWAGTVIALGFILPTASALTGWPLGPVFYPPNLGPKIGLIPFALPLLWLIIILGSREASWRLLPRGGHAAVVAMTGFLALLTTVNLDKVASTYRAWWLWYPRGGEHSSLPPAVNFVSWTVAGVALAWTMRTPHVVPRQGHRSVAPIAAVAFLNALALVTYTLIRWT
jgi:uncharacterized membrane protein